MANNITISKDAFLRAGEEGNTQSQREMLFDAVYAIKGDVHDLKTDLEGQMKCKKHASDIGWLKWAVRLLYISLPPAFYFIVRTMLAMAGG